MKVSVLSMVESGTDVEDVRNIRSWHSARTLSIVAAMKADDEGDDVQER